MIRLTLLLIVALPLLAPAADKPKTKASRHADIAIALPDNPVGLPDRKTVDMLTARAVELAPDLLGIPVDPDQVSSWLEFNWSGGPGGLTHLNFTVNITDPKAKPNALALADALLETLRKKYAEAYEKERTTRLAAATQAITQAQKALDEANDKFAQIKQEIRDRSGRSDTNNIASAVNALEEEASQLELDILAKTARREALEEQLAKQSKEIEGKMDNDPIAGELQKVVEAREQNIDRVKKMVTQNAASQAELSEAVGHAAEARAKLLERKRDAANEAGGDALAALNKEMMTLSIDLRELNARVDYIKSRLPRLREALDMTEHLIRASNERSSADSGLSNAKSIQVHEAERFKEQPEITVVNRASTDYALDPSGNVIKPPEAP